MLEKIICDKFVGADIANGTVAFHDGLNIVMGGEDADNSIGKSTMMLIIDYCFGGTSYPNEDIVEKVKGHEIRWIMNFGDKLKVLEPASLAESVKEKAQRIANIY